MDRRLLAVVFTVALTIYAAYVITWMRGGTVKCPQHNSGLPGSQAILDAIGSGEEYDCCGYRIVPYKVRAWMVWDNGTVRSTGDPVDVEVASRLLGPTVEGAHVLAARANRLSIEVPAPVSSCPMPLNRGSCVVPGTLILPIHVSVEHGVDGLSMVSVVVTVEGESSGSTGRLVVPLAGVGSRVYPLLLPAPVECGGVYKPPAWMVDANGDGFVSLNVTIMMTVLGGQGGIDGRVEVWVDNLGVVLPGGAG